MSFGKRAAVMMAFIAATSGWACDRVTPVSPTLVSATSVEQTSAADVKPGTGTTVVEIKGGSFVFEGSVGTLSLSGTHGFRLDGSASRFGVFEPYWTCIDPECEGGTTLQLDGLWSGADLVGTARIQGKTYVNIGSLNSDAGAVVHVSGSLTLPAYTGEPSSVTIPFELDGTFGYDLLGATPRQVALTGDGFATFYLVPHRFGGTWTIQRVEFDFGNAKRP